MKSDSLSCSKTLLHFLILQQTESGLCYAAADWRDRCGLARGGHDDHDGHDPSGLALVRIQLRCCGRLSETTKWTEERPFSYYLSLCPPR